MVVVKQWRPGPNPRESVHYGPFPTAEVATRWARSAAGQAQLRHDPRWLIVPLHPVSRPALWARLRGWLLTKSEPP